jgi:hypothetical protein
VAYKVTAGVSPTFGAFSTNWGIVSTQSYFNLSGCVLNPSRMIGFSSQNGTYWRLGEITGNSIVHGTQPANSPAAAQWPMKIEPVTNLPGN